MSPVLLPTGVDAAEIVALRPAAASFLWTLLGGISRPYVGGRRMAKVALLCAVASIAAAPLQAERVGNPPASVIQAISSLDSACRRDWPEVKGPPSVESADAEVASYLCGIAESPGRLAGERDLALFGGGMLAIFGLLGACVVRALIVMLWTFRPNWTPPWRRAVASCGRRP